MPYAPSDLVAIPPVMRTVIYYLIAEAIIVCSAVTAGATGWMLAQAIATGNAILFFGTAAAKVTSKPASAAGEPVVVLDPIGDELGEGV